MAAKPSYSKSLGPCKAARRQLSPAGPNWSRVGFILAVTLFLCSSYILAADPSPIEHRGGLNMRRANPGPPRYRVFSLRHIPAERGKKYLADAKIGTVSQLPGPNALLVTAQRGELIKASAILKLVDAKEPFVIKAIFPASSVKNLPSNEQIAAEVGNISIGTFSAPPTLAAKSKAIIDIHNDAVIAVAPASQLEKIITAIEQLQKGKSKALQPAKKPVEPNQISELKAEPSLPDSLRPMAGSEAALNRIAASFKVGGQGEAGDSESDELFDKLLGSLAEAEKRKAESRQVETEPNEPGTVVIVPGPNEPNEPSVGRAQPKEADFLAAILERLNALESAVVKGSGKMPVQREPERTEEDVVGKIEKPGEVVEPEPISNGDETLELDLPEKINIIQLLDLVSKFLGYDYMYDPVDVAGLKGEVTITMRKIKVKHLYPLLESVLKFKGFVMTREGNVLIVVPVAKVTVMGARLEPEKVGIGDGIITRFFELKHIDTASAQNLLAGMKLGVSITPIPEAKQLIVTEYAYRMGRIDELLAMIDKPGEPKKFRSRALEYTMATALAPKIKTLAEQLGTVSITIGAPSVAAPRPSAPPRGESSAARRARLAREAAARAAAARAAAARGAAATPAAAAQPSVYLDADERTNRILMIGLVEQLAIVDELIDTLDVEKQDLRTLRLYEIQNVDAEEVMKKLGELEIISGGQAAARGPARTTSRTTPTTTRVSGPTTPVTTRTGTTTTGETLVEEPQVVIIESTNSLLVNATAEQHAQIAMIIAYVDSEVEQGVIPYVIYPLENQDPGELAEVLNKLVMETTTKQDKEAKIVTTTKKLEEDIYIIPDPKTYSLIVYASKKNQQWISSLIEELDKYRPQVLLDVTLVEVTKNEEFTLDLDLVSKFPKLAAGASMDYLTAMIDPFPVKRITEAMSTSGAGSGFYADEHIQVLLTAMQTKGYGRILARPKLLVNDNEAGTIKTTEDKAIVSIETKVAAGVQQSVVAPSVKIEKYTAGITLDIQPHISKGDQLRLKIILTRTDFRINPDYSLSTPTGAMTGPTPPDLLTSDVQTVITVPDNKTIILGGLERISQSKGGTKVPLLGDIPLIGGLFRSTANTDSQSRLYVFVKAHILRPGEDVAAVSDIEVVSAKNRATFEKYEKEMQDYEDWPGIKPEPMDPVKILEADEEK